MFEMKVTSLITYVYDVPPPHHFIAFYMTVVLNLIKLACPAGKRGMGDGERGVLVACVEKKKQEERGIKQEE